MKLQELKNVKSKLIDEQKSLSLNTEKLNKFLYSKQYDELTREMRYLLIEQYGYMKNYLRVLNKRIAIINEQIKKLN